MSILFRYISREILKQFAVIATVVVVVYIAIDFFEKIEEVLKSGLPLSKFVFFFLLKIPLVLVQITPVASLVATLIVFGLMKRNNETTALKSCGLGMGFLLKPAAIVGAVAADSLTEQHQQPDADPGFQEFDGDLLFDLRVKGFVDPAHAAVAQLLDDLVAAGEGGARVEFVDGSLKGFRHDWRMVLGRSERRAAPPAEALGIRIVGMTSRAPVGQADSPAPSWHQTNRGTGAKSIAAWGSGDCIQFYFLVLSWHAHRFGQIP